MGGRFVEQRRAAERRGNEEGREHWDLYAGHRAAQTRELIASGPAGGTVCLLGAGNCNDVDLEALAQHYGEIHLVDIDPLALERASARQSPSTQAKLRRHGGIELSGVLTALDERKAPMRTLGEVEALLAPMTSRIVSRLPGPFDLVASCCIMTQLFHGIALAVGVEDPMLRAYQEMMTVVHLRAMASLVRPGRSIVLFNDLVSSETYPLDESPETDWIAVVDRLPDVTKVFEATNPVTLRRVVRRDAPLRAALSNPRIRAAWLWTAPLARTYLVYAMTLDAAAGAR